MQTFIRLSLSIALISICSPTFAQDVAITKTPGVTVEAGDWTNLLDKDLTQWEIWMGVPHTSVTGLPEGTSQHDKSSKGEPMGLDNDVKNVFTTVKDGDDLLLHITGEIYGGLTTKESFKNYHLQMKHRWGEKKWPKHGSFWKVWKSCVEYQVQEKDYGDLYLLAGPRVTARASKLEGKKPRFDPKADYEKHKGNITASSEPDLPNGEWNTIDIYVLGDAAIHVCKMRLQRYSYPNHYRVPPGIRKGC